MGLKTQVLTVKICFLTNANHCLFIVHIALMRLIKFKVLSCEGWWQSSVTKRRAVWSQNASRETQCIFFVSFICSEHTKGVNDQIVIITRTSDQREALLTQKWSQLTFSNVKTTDRFTHQTFHCLIKKKKKLN